MGHLNLNFKKTLQVEEKINNFYKNKFHSIDEVLHKIEDTASEQDILEFYSAATLDFHSSGGLWDNIEKNKIPPNIWRGIYKHSDDYFHNVNHNYTISVDNRTDKVLNLLDFGTACSPTLVSETMDSVNHYFIELNTSMYLYNKELYKEQKNIHVLQNISDIPSDVKFDIVISNDALEHVRFINEHLYALLHYGSENCVYRLRIDTDLSCGGHVIYKCEDTMIDDIWLNLN